MRFTRWWNPSLPQTLGIAVMLLYVDAVFSILALLGTGLGSSAYVFVAKFLMDDASTVDDLDNINTTVTLIVLAAALAYLFAGLAIANSQKIGWKVGVVVASGGVLLPLAAGGIGLVFGSTYVITYLFNVALLALLLHPEARNHQKIWFDGPAPRRRR